jgi:hypothetical protein
LYDRRHAEEILGIAGFGDRGAFGPVRGESTPYGQNLIVVNEIGVWPDQNIVGLSPGDGDLGWKPCWELADTPGAPDPKVTPGLPFPFTVEQLAAWMLHGLGWFVREEFGDWGHGVRHNVLTHPDQTWTREAVVNAFAAYRAAEDRLGGVHPAIAAADSAARRLRSLEEQAAQESHTRVSALETSKWEEGYRSHIESARGELDAAQAKADSALPMWRQALVRQLLLPSLVGTTQTRSASSRTNVLTAVLSSATETAVDSADASSVWNRLVAMANEAASDRAAASRSTRHSPLIGFADGEVKYLEGDQVRTLSRRAFGARFGRKRAP